MAFGEQQIDAIKANGNNAGAVQSRGTDLSAWIRSTLLPALSSQGIRTFALCVFATDILFIGIHTLNLALKHFGLDPDSHVLDTFLNVEHDGSLPEVFNYLKLTLISLVLFALYLGSRVSLYLVLAGCFAYAGLDDALRIHEQLGHYLADVLVVPAIAGATPGNLVEALYFAILAIVFTVALAIGWYRAETVHRRRSAPILAALCALFFFAVVIDLLHSLFGGQSLVTRRLAGLLEDSGEMLVITFTLWVALSVFATSGRSQDQPHDAMAS